MRRVALGLVLILSLAVAGTAADAQIAPGFVPSWCERTTDGYRCMAGPFDVGAGKRVETMTGVAAPSEAGYMTSGRATLVDADGEEIPHHMVHLHHAAWLNPAREDLTCDNYDGWLPNYDRFFATGKERTRFVLPEGYGYYWSNQAPQPYTQSAPFWVLVSHLDGVHGGSDVYIEFDMDFVPEAEATGMTDIRPVWLDVRNCNSDPVFTVKKGSGTRGVFRETWNYEMPTGGRFILMGGHLHDGGLKLKLRNVSTGDSVFTSKASYELKKEPWYLTNMSTFSGLPGKPVGAGDELRLTAVYDSTHTWPDVMGIMVGGLVP